MTTLALLGCGLAGRRRVEGRGPHRFVAVFDHDVARARDLASHDPACVAARSAAEAIAHPDVEAVVVATPHHLLVPLARSCAEAGRHVLVEKPGARCAQELDDLQVAAEQSGVEVRVGYNHRFHPGVVSLRRLVDSGGLGELMHLRGVYGHGGRPGYESEWRADPVEGGGGELLDQGVHLLDLATWLLGDLVDVHAVLTTAWWDMPVEDNAFLLGRSSAGAVVQLHASWTEWRNRFCLEVFGRSGKATVTGLGGSYGTETFVHHAMGPEMGPPTEDTESYPGPDRSWADELDAFCAVVEGAALPGPVATLEDAARTLRTVDEVYRSAGRPGRP